MHYNSGSKMVHLPQDIFFEKPLSFMYLLAPSILLSYKKKFFSGQNKPIYPK